MQPSEQPAARKKLTPVMRQYEDAKALHPDAILFFRMGDFYEMFNDDAVLVSRALNLTLTSRNKGEPDESPMAGVPHHAAHGYIARLLALGHKVAICEQCGDPSKIKGLVPRQVVRVVTPGLVTETEQLDARANHYLAAVDGGGAPRGDALGAGGPYGLSLLDLSTGELSATSVPDAATLLAELARADPREALIARDLPDVRAAAASLACRAALRDDEELDSAHVASILDDAAIEPISAAALAEHPLPAVRAAARALRFARRCSPGARIPVRRIAPHDTSGTLRIDETAQAHLELVRAADGGRRGTLLDVIDCTVTPGGARLLRRRLLSPLADLAGIRRRLDEVELFVSHPRARGELRQALGGVGDLERLSVRALLGEATPRDLGLLRDGLTAAPAAIAAVRSIPDLGKAAARSDDGAAARGKDGAAAGSSSGSEPLLAEAAALDVVADVCAELTAALIERPPPNTREGGIFREGYDKELDDARGVEKNATELILALEAKLRTQTGAPSLRVKYTRVFGWYIEVTRAHIAKVPETFRRKQTVATGERYTSDELDELADKIEHAGARALERETALFDRLRALVAKSEGRLRALARKLAAWDVAAALADVAHRNDYVRPHVTAGEALAIRDGRHPVVERYAAAGHFVPNDTRLDLSGERLWLITGPNMAGKSTLMRQVALIVVLAQMGSYVPAREAEIGLVDRILSRVGASDNVARGESTFMVEMRETAEILRDATRRSLVILDEIGRGTSTYDGLAIAWAVAEHLFDAIGCRALFATHYHELTELSARAPGIANYSVAAREHGDDVIFLHKLEAGPASRSYGVAVARLAGVPEGVLARARAILATLESGAALPGGKHASLRGRTRGGAAQLDLFAPAQAAVPPEQSAVIETLRAVDVDRLAPLDALRLVAKLKGLLGGGG
ncbi:DNA mismatch repair protein [Sorangium cellulosum So ce56]|uniref:DNA mismatch repair protein MutS n=1 Tax=Sorangium cellulosum (strain So ce56) TaxID=448385 RepID=MUTS_SORC5|nr:DNA mismatch repair protein MutS [Sorangium cellulosum]A9GIM9.1 RecName: Full=DNA mismatch repair protein MutS [Sorangium cellulosum So ce56]CAN93288.1 DNA mismatch repair protein [Sorangium cellulosum So ce56]